MAQRSDHRKLTRIIEELQKLRNEIRPEEEMTGDPLDIARVKTDESIKRVRECIDAIQHLQNDREIIQKKSELRRYFGEAKDNLSKAMDEIKKCMKQKLTGQKLAERNVKLKKAGEWAENAQSQLANLAAQAQNIKVSDLQVPDVGGNRSSERRKEDRNKRKAKNKYKGGNADSRLGLDEDNEINLDDRAPPSAQEQAFMSKVEQSYKQEEEMLMQLKELLDELHQLALELNKELRRSAELIGEMDEKMDKVQLQLDNANKRLEALLEESGGMTRWCPVCVCLCLILACVAFLYNKV